MQIVNDVHSSGPPFRREWTRWVQYDANARLSNFPGKQMRLGSPAKDKSELGTRVLLDFFLEFNQRTHDVGAVHVHNERNLPLSNIRVSKINEKQERQD